MGPCRSIAVIYGSDSSEWEISCRSGEFTADNLDGTRYDIYEIFARFGRWQLVAMRRRDAIRIPFPEGDRPEVDKTDFSVQVQGEKVRFDFAYIMQHGAPGETGQLQGYFEVLGIPFSTCSARVSAIAFDKYACKSVLRDADFVRLAPDAFIRRGMDVEAFAARALDKLGLPVFVKPTGGGSSFGITKVKEAGALAEAIRFAFSEDDAVIVEKAVEGREFTCAVYDEGVLPVIEVLPDNEYFDYEAKYLGKSREVCPAQIGADHAARIWQTAQRIYAYLGCTGLVRFDFIEGADGLYFLETNTIPGMTSASLVPKMVRAAGLAMTAFLTSIIEHAAG